jgi:hypothetical protein
MEDFYSKIIFNMEDLGAFFVVLAIFIGLGVIFYLGCLIHPAVGFAIIAICLGIIGTEILKRSK